MDARPRYLKNSVFNGEIVYNKNNEDPAHFILRLNTLNKQMPTYDLAGSSNTIISDSAEKSNPLWQKTSIFRSVYKKMIPVLMAGKCYCVFLFLRRFSTFTQFRDCAKVLWRGVENKSHFFRIVENSPRKSTQFRTFDIKTHYFGKRIPKKLLKCPQRNCVETK